MEETKLFNEEFNQIAKLWKRAIAGIADGFILLLPILVIIFVYFLIISGGNFANLPQVLKPDNIKAAIPLVEIILRLIPLAYFTYFIGRSGQTPGKKAMNVKVVNADGNIIGYKRAFFRSLIFLVYEFGNIGLLIFIISAIVAAVDKKKRSIHDRICETYVIGKEVEEAIERVRKEGKPRMSGPAIFSLVLSILCFTIPIFGQLICFYVAARVLHDIRQSEGLLKGKSLAITAIVISILYLIILVVLAVIMVFSSASTR